MANKNIDIKLTHEALSLEDCSAFVEAENVGVSFILSALLGILPKENLS